MIKYATTYLIILIFSTAIAAEVNVPALPTTEANSPVSLCDAVCGCNNDLVYDVVQGKCMLNVQKATERIIKYNENQDHDILSDSRLAKSIDLEADTVFRGMLISALFFLLCAGVCIFAACVYCCRINYTDRKLHSDVKALAKKLKRDYKSKPETSKATPSEPKSESCNVVVAQAGLYVV